MKVQIGACYDLNYWGFMVAVGIEERMAAIQFLCFNISIELL